MGPRVFLALAAAALAAPSAATIVTFDSQANPGFIAQYGPSYQEADLTFTIGNGSDVGLFSWGANQFNADPGGATIASVTANTGIIVTATGGGIFTLNAIDLASGFNDRHGGSVSYVLATTAGTSSGTFTLAHTAGLQTFRLDWSGVLSLTLQSAGGYQLDNVDYTLTGPAPTPEPGSWALMIAGFGAVGAGMRRTPRVGRFEKMTRAA